MRVLRRNVLAILATLCLGAGSLTARAEPQGPVVFAAASLKNALDDAAARWTKAGHPAPKISYAASNTLAQQIEQGAPADLFFSADLDWMNALAAHGLIDEASRVQLLGNSIVLVAPRDSARPIALQRGADLGAALAGGRLAMGNVAAVPAGKYGKAALEWLGIWPSVKDHIAEAESVRAALAFVARGEAPLGIVYATDAVAEPRVTVVGTFPEDSHPPIIYPVALVKGAPHPEAAAFLGFLRGAEARGAFEAQGFTVLNRPGQS